MQETRPIASSTRTTITHEGGLAFSASVRGHRVLTDQPLAAGGQDSAPSPLELLGAALGTCIALYVTQFCNARELSTAGLRVEVSGEKAKVPYRMGSFAVQLTLPADFPVVLHQAVERVARTCAVHNTLMNAPEITLGITRASIGS
jgi:putative redox protein